MTNASRLEELLNKQLPDEYKNFIDSKGFISKNGIEIYGYSFGLDISKIPSVIGATNLYKKIYPIDENELVITFDEIENSPILLNTKNGYIYKINSDNNKKIIYRNFNEFYDDVFKNN